jgi:hypothetical protein
VIWNHVFIASDYNLDIFCLFLDETHSIIKVSLGWQKLNANSYLTTTLLIISTWQIVRWFISLVPDLNNELKTL